MLAIREGAVYQKLGQMRAVEVSPGIGGLYLLLKSKNRVRLKCGT